MTNAQKARERETFRLLWDTRKVERITPYKASESAYLARAGQEEARLQRLRQLIERYWPQLLHAGEVGGFDPHCECCQLEAILRGEHDPK